MITLNRKYQAREQQKANLSQHKVTFEQSQTVNAAGNAFQSLKMSLYALLKAPVFNTKINKQMEKHYVYHSRNEPGVGFFFFQRYKCMFKAFNY